MRLLTAYPSGEVEASRFRTPLSQSISHIGGAKGFHPFATSALLRRIPIITLFGRAVTPQGAPFNQPIYPELHPLPLLATRVSRCCHLLNASCVLYRDAPWSPLKSQHANGSWDGRDPKGNRAANKGSRRPEEQEGRGEDGDKNKPILLFIEEARRKLK